MKRVLLPYEITLFSNCSLHSNSTITVLLPYEITLFSNVKTLAVEAIAVLLPYEITLFSNAIVGAGIGAVFYYLMKLHYSQTDV